MLNAGFQYLEQRDAADAVTKEGVVGKNSPFATSDNSGIYDIIAEDLRWLKENVDDVKDTSDLETIKKSVSDAEKCLADVEAVKESLSKMITYQGSVDNFSDLPTSPQVGYSYNVKNTDKEHNVNAGDNLVWNGTDWDNLSGIVDMSAYAELNKDVSFGTVTATAFKGKADMADTATTCSGNAATASKLETARKITLTGKAAGSAMFDGSKDIDLEVTKLADGVTIGAIMPFSGNGDIPAGYLLCDGAAVSRTMYPDLFGVIGTTYGAGDGSTTFNLPDLTDKFIEGGKTAGTSIMRYIIKAFDGAIADSALIDITNIANELAGKADRNFGNITDVAKTLIKDTVIKSALLQNNGYICFSNGLIIQWQTGNSGQLNTFPLTFNQVFSCVVIPVHTAEVYPANGISVTYNVSQWRANLCTVYDCRCLAIGI